MRRVCSELARAGASRTAELSGLKRQPTQIYRGAGAKDILADGEEKFADEVFGVVNAGDQEQADSEFELDRLRADLAGRLAHARAAVGTE